jgi:phage-related baseplate assembly protein
MRLLPNTPVQVYADAVDRFTKAMTSRIALGRDLTRSWIISQLHVSGVYEINVIEPAGDIECGPTEFVQPGTITVSLGIRAE